MENESSMKDIIRSSLEQVRTILDADTVVGHPIDTGSGTTIIPISKVSMGFASGGLDLPGQGTAKNFGGGGGTGVSVVPIGFLTITKDGKVDMLPMTGKTDKSPLDQLIEIVDTAPALYNRIKDFFTKTVTGKDSKEDYADKVADDAAQQVEEEQQQPAPEGCYDPQQAQYYDPQQAQYAQQAPYYDPQQAQYAPQAPAYDQSNLSKRERMKNEAVEWGWETR